MKKRTARRVAAATAMAAPVVAGLHVAVQSAPAILTPAPKSAVGGRAVTIFARYTAPRPVATAKVFLDNALIATRTFQPAGLSGVVNLTWDSTAAIPGAHHITIKLYDRTGAMTAMDSVPITVVNGTATDTVPPQIAILSPNAAKPMQGVFGVRVLATDNSGKDPYVSVFVDEQLRGVSNRQPYSFPIDSTHYANGQHTIEAWALDAAGNKAVAGPVRFHVDNPGGATALNEAVNQLGATPSPAPDPVLEPPTVPTLPDVAAPILPGSTPSANTAPAPPDVIAHDATSDAVSPALVEPETIPAPTSEALAEPKTSPAPPAPVVHPEVVAPTPTPTPTPTPAPAPPPVAPASQPQTKTPALAQPVVAIPVVKIPPVREVAVTPRPEPISVEPKNAQGPAVEAATARDDRPLTGIRELPEDPPASPRMGIQELPTEEPPLAPAGAAEPVAAAAPEEAAAPPVRVARAEPARGPRFAAPARVESLDAPKAPDIEVPVPPSAPRVAPPIVLTMRGETVLDEPPAPAIVASAPEPRRAPVTAGNPAREVSRMAAVAPPTAAAVKRPALNPTQRVARASEGLRPVLIPELAEDRVRDGRIHHDVRPGETLRRLATAYGMPEGRLLAENRLKRRSQPRVGQTIIIPAPFRVACNGATVAFDVAPRVQNGVSLVAMRHLCEAAGATVTWVPERREVHVRGGGTSIIVRIASHEAIVGGRRVALKAPAYIEEGRTILPVAFLSESLGLEAEYDLRTGTIRLNARRPEADRRRPA